MHDSRCGRKLGVTVQSPDCQLPLPDFADRTRYFDVDAATIGDVFQPFSGETMAHNSEVRIAWLQGKCVLFGCVEPKPGEPSPWPWSKTTMFSLDLVSSANASEVVQQVMVPVLQDPFYSRLAPDCNNETDFHYDVRMAAFEDQKCPTPSFTYFIYKWTVPINISTEEVYRLRLTSWERIGLNTQSWDYGASTQHYSGDIRIKASSDGVQTDWYATWTLLFVIAVLLLGSMICLLGFQWWRKKARDSHAAAHFVAEDGIYLDQPNEVSDRDEAD